MKNKNTAGLIALILGGIGFHKFYLGQILIGLIYLLFAFTFIPAIIGFLEALVLFSMKKEDFDKKYNLDYMIKQKSYNELFKN